ncbi:MULTISPECIES: hypothetical protein [unclassified Escherichia]|uniref:hypothetical protein n=1 Tax=unclassified Escherichia TaxID=2608889 RepID=UPI001029D0B5|nr:MULTISPECIES: hypothetical protein [unclassified Escherichia]RZM92121.1 hypothetical protein D9740_22015 [Escherichia sp. E14V5]RZN00699.1 hypothetical protein D9741_19770 [Escherichia sp. E14V7]RZN17415.1 hypothetical protein D9734_21105 [Escherichia sp. E14S1]RZN23707.1 hypothetical protein D9739_22615 [Escherichia sp. E14V10]
MQNTDDTFSWDSNNQQTFRSAGETTLKGPAETFNKMQGCGLDVYGVTMDGTQSGPLILIPDSIKSNQINWAVQSAAPKDSSFKFFEKADFRISGNRKLKNKRLIDSSLYYPEYKIAFSLYDDSRVTLEELQGVFLGMSSLETATSTDFTGLQNSKFSILADSIGLFYKATLSGYSTLDVHAYAISAPNRAGIEPEGLRFNNYSSLLLNVRSDQHLESELKLSNSLSFHDSSYGNIFTMSIHNDIPDNNTGDFVAINAFDNSTVDIHTAQFLQGYGKGKIIQLSGNAKVTINPLIDIVPINPVKEVINPTGKCWPGMFNFKSGSGAVLRLNAHSIGTQYDVNALYLLNLVYIDGKPIDNRNKLSVDFDSGGLTIQLR